MVETWLESLPQHGIFELPPPPCGPSLSTHPSLSELARPPSPALSSIFAQSSRNRKGTADKYAEQDRAGGRKARVVLARGVDLIVAVGREIRIASLNDLKSRVDAGAADGREVGEYKTLHTPSITFDIQQLVLNSTSKLLAVVGLHSVAVVVLPRKGWAESIGASLDCRSLLVGRFYHALPASSPVAQVGWHPWGLNASSLLVLTVDATLREYAIEHDAEEPAQTVSLAPKQTEPRGFSADDEDEGTAVAFALGEGTSDWGPMTLYGLMRSGDVVALCPFLPKKACIPSSYIHSLSSYVSTKIDALGAPPEPLALVPRSRPSVDSPRPSPVLAARYTHQLQYVTSLVHQAANSSRPLATADEDDDSVRINAPRNPASVSRQGPFLMQPAPAELENGHESLACDLAYVSADGLGVLAIAYADGKVDLCLEVDKVDAVWGADSSSPTLAVSESIDLGLEAQDLADNYPTFVRDPLYGDVLYVYHALGAHCLIMARWLDAVSASRDGDEAEVERTLRELEPTQVLWVLQTELASPVVGLALVSDVYLGYTLLVLTSQLQLVAISLSLRVDTPGGGPSTPTRLSSDAPAYLSLLDTPFAVPALFTQPLPAIPHHTTTSSPLTITPATLRQIGTTVEDLRHRIRSLVSASDVIQTRLELQMKELARQLDKLHELSNQSDEMRSSTRGQQNRLADVSSRQERLLARMDRLLQRLMDSHEPTLSTYETKWFAELGRLEMEIKGDVVGSLERRTERVKAMLDELLPVLELIRRGEGAPTPSKSEVMGDSQVRVMELKLAEEAKLITEAKRRIDRLTSTLAATTLAAP